MLIGTKKIGIGKVQKNCFLTNAKRSFENRIRQDEGTHNDSEEVRSVSVIRHLKLLNVK